MLVWVLLLTFLQAVKCTIPAKDYNPDVFILTDISNEPDDAQSLVRLLLYSNEVNVKGIAATTSYWLNETIHDEDIYPILDAYEKVHPNLLLHSPNYPTADYFRSIVTVGKPVYGLAALDDPKVVSSGAKLLLESLNELKDDDHLFVLVWGGANVLAEALNQLLLTAKKAKIDEVISRLTVYSISDQDNSGPWIRYNFPKLKYVASIHGFNHYGQSTWVGISGEVYNAFDLGGPDTKYVSKEWIKENIQNPDSELGKVYPDVMFNMEGDTPSTLFVLPNGLNWPLNPEYGGWGGRHTLSDLSGNFQHFGDTQDHVIGVNGERFVSNKATIWRWRDAFQNDFKHRMKWTTKSFEDSAHEPIVIFNDTEASVKPAFIDIAPNSTVVLDLSKSYDLNDSKLKYKWMHYREISATQGNLMEVPEIAINNLNKEGSIVSLQLPDYEAACLNFFKKPQPCKVYHIIAEVTNEAGVKGYKRFVFQLQPDPNVDYGTFEPLSVQSMVHDEL